ATSFASRRSRALPTVLVPSRSSSGMLTSKRSSRAITNSTRSRLSASRSAKKRAPSVTASRSTPSTVTMASRSCPNTSLRSMNLLLSLEVSEVSAVSEVLATHAQAAVDRQDGAGDEGSRVRAQEGDRRRHLLDGAEAAERDLAGELVAARLGQVVGHSGGDGPRLDDVGGDVARRELARHR